jgi:NAD(P)-dependent dehydrogenase (short-subunit alcohol dehydrogenase family)
VDITEVHSVADMVALAVSEFGRIDYLVNSAGVSAKRLFSSSVRLLDGPYWSGSMNLDLN